MIDTATKPVTILFVHGWWAGGWVWENWLPWFEQRGYQCVAPTLRGHANCSSTANPGRISFYDHLDELRTVIREINTPVAIIGHSAGGLMAMKLAEERDLPISAVVGLAPGPPRGIFGIASLELAKTSLRYAASMIFQRPFLLTETEMVSLNLNMLSPVEQKEVFGRMQPVSGKLVFESSVLGIPVNSGAVRCPVFITTGGKDNLTPPRVTHAIAREYATTHREYPNHGHYLIREKGWEIIAEEIRIWLLEQYSDPNRQMTNYSEKF